MTKDELEKLNRKLIDELNKFIEKNPPKTGYIWGFSEDGILRQFHIGED
jgi:hypothetical protein